MAYDKYRNWPIKSTAIPIMRGMELKEVVLQDLAAAADLTEKLEILDSFEAWVKRGYSNQLAQELSEVILKGAAPMLSTIINSKIPSVTVTGRPRVGKINDPPIL